ncbi:uncharacterized protein B0T23DRAFT_17021 [Neurospora hispaniola]|uniref:Uncharacterized protein n=1 Tax=Neurospora hispaniola TaxID=588809 RepID=A0AAJ0IFF6_9PEZI|nr:hypothetical protein B0T23DRAFT_17021 [Neurospora hispaniola]
MPYEKVPNVESSSESLLHSISTPDCSEQRRCIRREPKYTRAWRLMRDEWPRPARIVLAINVALSVLLLCLYLHALWRIHSSPFYRAPRPPYSPLLEDGVIEYENERFHPDRIFQEDPSPSVDKAWESILGPSDGRVRLPLVTSQKLSYPSSEIYYAPGSYIYGGSMFHQLHCLDLIRRSFWRGHYFPNTSDAEYHDHRAHCLDFLRQAIMCNGDVQMTYWWNKTYTYVDEDTKEERYTEEYLRMDKKERAYGTALLWDVEHQCRSFERIQDWTRKHQLRDEEYWREAPNFRKAEA